MNPLPKKTIITLIGLAIVLGICFALLNFARKTQHHIVSLEEDLKATQAFRDLQVQLEGTENRIATERHRYNEVARDFNTTRRAFPTIFIANFFGFGEKAYFEAVEGAEEPPVVEF